jgi:hypothetical protein
MADTALTLVSGAVATGSLSSNRKDIEYMTGIAYLTRWSLPLTMLAMMYQTYESPSDEIVWSEDEPVPYQTQVSGEHAAAATDITVDDATPFVAGMRVKMINATGTEVCLVTAVNDTTNVLTVIRDYGRAAELWTAQNMILTDDTYVQRLDAVYMQAHPLPDYVSTTPRERKQYIGKIRTPLGLTERALMNRLRFDDDEMARHELLKHEDHGVKIETANIDGKPVKGTEARYNSNAGNVSPMASGGIEHYLVEAGNTALIVDEEELTQFELHDYYEAVFEKGSKDKLHVVPSSFRTGLDRWGISKQNTFAEGTVIGMAVDTYKSSHGRITYLTHEFMKAPAATLWDRTFVLDLAFLYHVLFAGGSTKLQELDGYRATGVDATEKEWATYQCVIPKQPGKVHGRLRYKTMAAA